VTEGPLRLLDWAAHPVVINVVVEVSQLVGTLDLPVGAGGVDEDDVQVEVEQVRDRGEHLGGDLVQRRKQEVHPPVGLIVAEPCAALDRDPFRDPPGRGELAARLQGALGDQGEDDPFDRFAVQTSTRRDQADRRADPEAFPEAVEVQDPPMRRESRTSTSTPCAASTLASPVNARSRVQAVRSAAMVVAISQAWLMVNSRDGNRFRPVSLACRIRSSTRAWARWRASRNGSCPVVVLVAMPW